MSKILLLGADGFIGTQVAIAAEAAGHIVLRSTYNGAADERYQLDLSDSQAIRRVIEQAHPDILINCAGIVDNSEKAALNVLFTTNIFTAVEEATHRPERIIITGSAAEYGEVSEEQLPVSETAKVAPVSTYGEYKAEETKLALERGKALGVPVIVARLFNPLGANMHPRLLLPNLILQAKAVAAGKTDRIELSRLDAKRDYIDVRDIATAYVMLAKPDAAPGIYNIGSGAIATNGDIIRALTETLSLPNTTSVVETAEAPERLMACQADITKLRALGWTPRYSLKETIKGVL
jgi:GDP-4-dehydro-6-deoxy-D-mannose reductase